MEPPQILRIKRKRGQDPLQALILGDSQAPKRSKPSSPKGNSVPQPLVSKSYYFHLAATDDHTTQPDSEVLASVLSEARSKGTNKRKRQFVIPKQQTEEDTIIPHELAEMLDDLLVEDVPRVKKRRGRKRQSTSESERGEEEQNVKDQADIVQNHQIIVPNSNQSRDQLTTDYDDYVFDVYKLSTAETLTNANYPSSQIGYIRFYDDDEFDLLQSDDENRSPTANHSDDEDSNAESFYQNDYPEDEDAGTYSDSYEFDNDNYAPIIVDSVEDAEAQAYLGSHVQADMAEPQHYDDLYDDFFDEDGNQVADLVQGDDDYERQNFFPGEEDDALAVHRDKIFGRLQRMINE